MSRMVWSPGSGNFLGKPVGEIKRGDPIAIERSNFPHHVVPDVVLENDRFVTPFVVLVRQFVGAVIVQHEGARDGGRTNDVGVHPERDAVVAAPVFAGKLSGGHKIFPLPATVNLRDIGRGTHAQRMPAIFDVDVAQRHLSHAGERPGREVFHAVQQARFRGRSCLAIGIRRRPHTSAASASREPFAVP